MYTISKITFIVLLLTLWVKSSYAQYIPQSHRKSNIKLHTIKIKKGQQITAARPVLFCDTLIMEDESTLRVPHTIKSFTLYALYCKIGKRCTIAARGKDGKVGVIGKYKNLEINSTKIAEAGTNAPHLNLYLNIYALGNLVVDATGGKGAPAQISATPELSNLSSAARLSSNAWTKIPGIYGSGGNVNLHYHSPIVINIKKKNLKNQHKRRRKKASKKPEIVIGNTVGNMDTRAANNYFRTSNYNPNISRERPRGGIFLSGFIARETKKRKNGQFKFTRKGTVIKPEEAKIK
ncbi:hypothetical protein BKI52_00715 [marine bacterium AO1-C]|nr:hypothetical protein BKI52_00715 [marine bacterium AO1-C]